MEDDPFLDKEHKELLCVYVFKKIKEKEKREVTPIFSLSLLQIDFL